MGGQTNILVVKADGQKEPFSEIKVRQSIRKSAVPKSIEDALVKKVKKSLYQNIPTRKIYEIIARFLEVNYPIGSCRYHLKQAIMELGPTGYPFEKFIAELLKQHGYTTETNLILAGKCVNHEIDVLAKKSQQVYFVECKYHNQYGARSEVRTVLYVKARLDDLRAKISQDDKNIKYNAWIFTNTKFSQDAISYAQCQNMRLTGWNYPKNGNLQEMIGTKKLYPVTCLSSLSPEQKRLLLQNNIVLAKDVFESKFAEDLLKLGSRERDLLAKEARIF